MTKSQYQIKSKVPMSKRFLGFKVWSFIGNLKLVIGNSSISGFTLIEVVVVLGIFLVASTAATSIFVSANKASRRTIAIERVGGDARWVMEKMVDDIRLATIDYDALHLDTEGKTSQLSFITQEQKAFAYGLVDGAVVFTPTGSITGTSITAKNVAVQRLDFYVWPAKSPFVLARDGRELGQPRVTIVFETETTGGKKEEQSRLSLQTTVSTRVYKK